MDKYIFTVSELNRTVKQFLEGTNVFKNLLIEGELSNITYYKSGHLYFTLKDENSTVRCVSFNYAFKSIPKNLKDGDRVKIEANVTLYDKTGQYQLSVEKIENKNSIGDLYKKLEELKQYYYEKGYFDIENKKELPILPLNIGIVTAETGAAIKDIIDTTHKRFNNVNIYLYPSKVQGEGASLEISRGIEVFNKYVDKLNIDLLIVGRGGGSIEDLWSFNEPEVIEAIYKSNIPVISAVGHEIDNLLSDLVADVRAATPTQAAEIAIPDKSTLIKEVRVKRVQLSKELQLKLKNAKETISSNNKSLKSLLINNFKIHKLNLESLKKSYILRNFPMKINEKRQDLMYLENDLDKIMKTKYYDKIDNYKSELTSIKNRCNEIMMNKLQNNQRTVDFIKIKLDQYNSTKILKQGYSITRKNGKIVNSIENLNNKDRITTELSDGKIESVIDKKEEKLTLFNS